MDDSRLSRFPHLSWTHFPLRLPSGGQRLRIEVHATTCVISIALNGRRSASRITHGQQREWSENSGMVSVVPADRDQHTYLMTSDSGCDLFNVLIPPSHLMTVAEAEGLTPVNEWTPMFGGQDAVLQGCMARVAATSTSEDKAGDVSID